MSPGKALVDYGKRIGIVDPATGEIHEEEIFVGVLGASNLTYAEATATQQLPDWIGARVRTFPLLRRRPEIAGSREERRRQGIVLRSGGQPNLWRDGGALLGWNFSARRGKPKGQGDCFIPHPVGPMAAKSARGGLDDRAHSSL